MYNFHFICFLVYLEARNEEMKKLTRMKKIEQSKVICDIGHMR